jgi:hypothetical protein
MIGTITPLVQEVRERNGVLGVGLLVSEYTLSAVLGSFLLALVLWLIRTGIEMVSPSLSSAVHRSAPLIIGAIAAYVVLAVLTLRLPLPMRDEQVPARWRETLGPRRALMAYSFLLGVGLFTRVNSPAFYVVVVAGVVAPSPALAFVLPIAFGIARGGVVVVNALLRERHYMSDPEGDIGAGLNQRRLLTGLQFVMLSAVVVTGILLGTIGGG